MNRHRISTARRASSALLALGVLGAAAPATAADPADTSWTLRYAGRSTNAAINDPEMADMLHALLPTSLVEPVTLNLWGPPEPVLWTGPLVSMSACRSHDCGSKAFLWIDTAHNTGLAATADCGLYQVQGEWKWRVCQLTIGSRSFDAATVPAPAREALKAWIADRDLGIARARFVGADDVGHELDASWR